MKIKALEFLGLPGSGKTFLYNSLIKKLRYENISFTTYKESFIQNLYNKQKGLNKIFFYLYLLYEKNYQLKSNYLFLSQYRFIISNIITPTAPTASTAPISSTDPTAPTAPTASIYKM